MALNMRPSGLVLEKKRISAWYDTSPVYLGLILFALATAVFALAGIKVGRDTPEYSRYVWVPYLLLAMSSLLMVSGGFRLIYRIYLKLRDRV